ncbi:hypothetical protein [Streptomyces sp. NPDC002587]
MSVTLVLLKGGVVVYAVPVRTERYGVIIVLCGTGRVAGWA